MSATEPDQPTEQAAEPVVDDLGDINSLEDIRALFNDGIDRLKEAGVEDFKEAGRRLANRGLKGWRKLIDTFVEGKG